MQSIRAKQDKNGDLYINLEDLKETFQKDWGEVFHEEYEQAAGNIILMTLEVIKHWYKPYAFTSCPLGDLALSFDQDQDEESHG